MKIVIFSSVCISQIVEFLSSLFGNEGEQNDDKGCYIHFFKYIHTHQWKTVTVVIENL